MAGDAEMVVDGLSGRHLRLRWRGDLWLRCARWKILQIDRNRAKVSVANLRGRMDHDVGNQAVRMAFAIAAARKVLGDVIDAPRLQPAASGLVEPRSEPALHKAAAKGPAAPVGAEHVLRGVAGAAMCRARDEISAAIPFGTFLLVRLGDCRTGGQINSQPHEQPVI